MPDGDHFALLPGFLLGGIGDDDSVAEWFLSPSMRFHNLMRSYKGLIFLILCCSSFPTVRCRSVLLYARAASSG